jgi:N-acetyl-anhydromuramyl-L-alanine amidase AmpD
MYSTESSFLELPVGSVGVWADSIRPHNPAQADAIAAAYFRDGVRIGLNADLALAQACHESAWFTARHWTEQFDPCGLGVTGDDAPGGPPSGATFASLEEGIEAHYEHLACYAMAADPPAVAEWGPLDPRHDFHDGMPRVADLVRPERKWAVPGDGYAAAIVAIANRVIGETTMNAPPTEADIGYPVRVHAAADVGPARDIAEIVWFIVHDTEGHFAGDETILTSAAPPVESAHALIDRDGTLVFMVPLDRTAWTPGNDDVAHRSINVELSGFATEPYTDAQYRALAAFFRWCAGRGMPAPAVYVGKEERPGICGHQDVADPDHPGAWGGVAHHTDPGPLFRWETLVGYINQAPVPPALFYADGNPLGKIPMAPPFWNRWHALDTLGLALPMMGYPEAAERMLANGRRVQRFERGWFGTQDAPDPWNVVALFPAEWPADEAGSGQQAAGS